MEKVILVFIDGIGIGAADPGKNPVRELFTGISSGLFLDNASIPCDLENGYAIGLDACLGVPGIPQSATGQTSLFTGISAQGLLGYHLNAMPNEPLIKLLHERSLPVLLKKNGKIPVNANLHTPDYFRHRRGGHKNRFPVSTIMTFASRSSFLFEKDYKDGKGIFMDITGQTLVERGLDIPVISPEDAASRLVYLTKYADYVNFEYFLTDKWGHKRNRERLDECLGHLIRFIGDLSRKTRQTGVHLVITSDHGNSEDFSIADHTRNPVPLVHIFPQGWENTAGGSMTDLTDVYKMIMNLYRIDI